MKYISLGLNDFYEQMRPDSQLFYGKYIFFINNAYCEIVIYLEVESNDNVE